MEYSTTQTSVTQTSTGTAIAGPTRFMPHWASMLVNDINANQFADSLGTTINHPAFVLGHVAYYAGVAMQILGGDIELSDHDATLYQHGAPCSTDASIYPEKDAAIAAFNERLETVATFIESCDESVFARSSKDTPFAQRFSTLGGVATFMLIGHISFHLGQISAWRRVAGMEPAN